MFSVEPPLQPLRASKPSAKTSDCSQIGFRPGCATGASSRRRRRRHDRPVPPAVGQARPDRPLGASGRVPLVPGAGRGAGLRLRLQRAARPLVLSRRRAAPRSRERRPSRRLLASQEKTRGAARRRPLEFRSVVVARSRQPEAPRAETVRRHVHDTALLIDLQERDRRRRDPTDRVEPA